MKKFLLILPLWLFMSGCAELIVENNKSYFVEKRVAERYFNSGKGLSEWDPSIYKISDVKYNYGSNGEALYNLVLLDENNKSHYYPISRTNLIQRVIPESLVLADSSEYKKALQDKKDYLGEKQREEDLWQKEKIQRKRNIAQFEKACPECSNIYLVHKNQRCPLSMSTAISQCKNIRYKKNSSKKISVYMEECPKGDVSIVFSYGTQFAQVESLFLNGSYILRNAYNAEQLDETVFGWCWIALTSNNK